MALSLQAVKDPASDQNFRRIAQQFPITGGNLAGVVKSIPDGEHKEDWGTASASFSSAFESSVEVEHGLGATPTNIQVTSCNSAFVAAKTGKSATKIKVTVRNVAGASFTGTVEFEWRAVV